MAPVSGFERSNKNKFISNLNQQLLFYTFPPPLDQYNLFCPYKKRAPKLGYFDGRVPKSWFSGCTRNVGCRRVRHIKIKNEPKHQFCSIFLINTLITNPQIYFTHEWKLRKLIWIRGLSKPIGRWLYIKDENSRQKILIMMIIREDTL